MARYLVETAGPRQEEVEARSPRKAAVKRLEEVLRSNPHALIEEHGRPKSCYEGWTQYSVWVGPEEV